jgi:hypothetical protein
MHGGDLPVRDQHHPGFTPISLFPILCGRGGDFGGICAHIVELAVARAGGRAGGSNAPTCREAASAGGRGER